MKEKRCDILIAGGGLGGVAAALSAARLGHKVILTEETDWLGGQMTSQCVSAPDQHPWIESFGATESYYQLLRGIRDYYRANFLLTPAARAERYLNPGNGNVSSCCHEPRVSLAVLDSMLAPFRSAGTIEVLMGYRPTSAEVEDDRVHAVTYTDMQGGAIRLRMDESITIAADYFLDATELGDLLPLTRTEYVTGAESQADTGEPHAVEGEAQPENVQSFTVCFYMDHIEGEDHANRAPALRAGRSDIDKPEDYEWYRDHRPLGWIYPHPWTLQPRLHCLFPDPEGKANSLWLFRRVLDRSNFIEGAFASDVTLVNWPANDYLWGNLIDKPEEEVQRHIRGAKNLSLSLLYWLQTEAPRPDGGTGWPGLRLRHDWTGTRDGLAKYPYIRESRRIVPQFRVVEQHVASALRKERLGEKFFDSVGIGLYRIDLHPSASGVDYIDVGCCPFTIPLGALIPIRIKNLIAANKNIGATHITNGAYRLHPVEWNIGESAGALASFCLDHNVEPVAVREKPNLLQSFQDLLRQLGIPLEWPEAGPV